MERLSKGTVLRDRYEIESVLGKGGFGITYRAYDRLMEVPVAVKQYDTERMSDGREARKEAKIAAGFYDLEGIAAARDYFVENGICYIVMEYVDGVSVKRYIHEHGRMNGGEVLEKLRPILQSISRIHKKGVIHRDISADNLLVTKDGKLKLIDFGAARVTEEYRDKTFTLIFKRGFAPVEQCHAHGAQGPWTDIYSLCATVYFMITGIVPDDAVERMIEDHVKPLPQIHGTGLSAASGAALMRGLAVRQEDRFQNVRELYEALYGAAKEEETEQQTETTHTLRESTTSLMREIHHRFYGRKRKSLRKKRFRIAAGGILAVFLLSGILFLVMDRGESPIPQTGRPEPERQAEPATGPVAQPSPESSAALESSAASGASDGETVQKHYRIGNYTGMTEKKAKKALKAYQKEGLKITVRHRNSSQVKKGRVISQKPKAGRTFESLENVRVLLVVSKGKKPPAPSGTPSAGEAKPSPGTGTGSSRKKDSPGDNIHFSGDLDDVIG